MIKSPYIGLLFVFALMNPVLNAKQANLMPQNEKTSIEAVENGLRDAVIIEGEKPQHMNLIDRMAHYGASAVSIAVVDHGKLAWAKAYGKITNFPDSKTVDTHSLFQAASISKSIAALGALLLVQQGKLSLDEDVNSYLKSWKVPENKFTKTQKVTLRRLLSHSAGTSVGGFIGYTVDQKIPFLVDILEGKKPLVNSDPIEVVEEPGKEMHYSGGGTTIVQQLIEDVTGEKFDVWMKRNILNPLGMRESTFSQPLETPEKQHAVYGHTQGKQMEGNWHVYPEMGAAGLWTTPSDYSQFIISLQKILAGEDGIISKSLAQEMITPLIKHAGLGVFVFGEGKDLRFMHGGQNIGYLSQYDAYPYLKQGMVIMVNDDTSRGLIDEIERSIADVYKMPGFGPLKKRITSMNPSLFKNFTGVFKGEGQEIEVKLIDNKIVFNNKFSPSVNFDLFPEKENTFFSKENGITLKFVKTGKNFDTIKVTGPNLPESTFKKVTVAD